MKSNPFSHPHLIVFIFLVTLTLVSVSCAPAPTPTEELIPTSVPITPTTSPTPTPSAPVISPESFAGIWKCCTGYEYHTVDGDFDFEHALFALLTTGLSGKITIEGDVLTITDHLDCNPSEVGKYRITVKDAGTYRLTLIEDPCTWRATSGSAPMDGATYKRTKPLLTNGSYTAIINQADAEQAGGGDLLMLVGEWNLQLEVQASGKSKYVLSQDGNVVDEGRYINVDNEFVINVPALCTSRGEPVGTFKIEVDGDNVSFFKRRADCPGLIFVLKTQPWVKQ